MAFFNVSLLLRLYDKNLLLSSTFQASNDAIEIGSHHSIQKDENLLKKGFTFTIFFQSNNASFVKNHLSFSVFYEWWSNASSALISSSSRQIRQKFLIHTLQATCILWLQEELGRELKLEVGHTKTLPDNWYQSNSKTLLFFAWWKPVTRQKRAKKSLDISQEVFRLILGW